MQIQMVLASNMSRIDIINEKNKQLYVVQIVVDQKTYKQEYNSDMAICKFLNLNYKEYQNILIQYGGRRIGVNIYFENDKFNDKMIDVIDSLMVAQKLASKNNFRR